VDATAIISRLRDHALASGHFERVNGAEPKSAPGNGLSAAYWVDEIRPYPGGSGLDSTSLKLVVMARLYSSFLAEPVDAIDPQLVTATAALMSSYSAGFALDGLVRNIDLLGESDGVGLYAKAGYLNLDNKIYRVMTIQIPMIVSDVFDQEA
jgi:hypothetical protein